MIGSTRISELEKLVHALEIGKPAFDGEDINYDVATIENAVEVIRQYIEILRKVNEFYAKTKRNSSFTAVEELKDYLEEYRSHQLCLASQILDMLQEEE